MRSQKEPSGFLISCQNVLVAERITFDVYMGIQTHSDRLLFVYYK